MVELKKCSRCQATLPTSAFNKNSSRYDRLDNYCRSCRGTYIKPYIHAGVRRWRHKPGNRAKEYAWELLAKAVKRGEIVRPDICPRCEKDREVVAHHHDYSKPLEVEFMCRACHTRMHREVHTLK